MQRIEYKNPVIDREGWPEGPWDDEPDKIQWLDEATSLPCLIVRNRMGGLCGYVGVPPGHRFYEVGYDSVTLSDSDEGYDEASYPPVHGGLTFADRCADGPEDRTICHAVEEGESDDVWWLGFDCGHWQDLLPGMLALDAKLGLVTSELQTYKDVAYVKRNIEELAVWLKSA